ncbi:GNAT family N-acetyltransferase [Saccharibacillus sacchari]|uniref:GNAT family N-acetyltransferase n=1 Tax=Saccharibacillus sacchari TaxID=456493 RepID=A0ACC6P749_9BACL
MANRNEAYEQWEFQALTLSDAKKINNWSYEPPYAMYSFDGDDEDLQDLIGENYLGAYDAEGELVGFLCSGEAAQVPGARLAGLYEVRGYLDIGLGLRPDLTGRGIGEAFLRNGMNVLSERSGVNSFRLAVASFNKRAIEVYRRAGFREDRSFVSMVGIENVSFIQMLREDG